MALHRIEFRPPHGASFPFAAKGKQNPSLGVSGRDWGLEQVQWLHVDLDSEVDPEGLFSQHSRLDDGGGTKEYITDRLKKPWDDIIADDQQNEMSVYGRMAHLARIPHPEEQHINSSPRLFSSSPNQSPPETPCPPTKQLLSLQSPHGPSNPQTPSTRRSQTVTGVPASGPLSSPCTQQESLGQTTPYSVEGPTSSNNSHQAQTPLRPRTPHRLPSFQPPNLSLHKSQYKPSSPTTPTPYPRTPELPQMAVNREPSEFSRTARLTYPPSQTQSGGSSRPGDMADHVRTDLSLRRSPSSATQSSPLGSSYLPTSPSVRRGIFGVAKDIPRAQLAKEKKPESDIEIAAELFLGLVTEAFKEASRKIAKESNQWELMVEQSKVPERAFFIDGYKINAQPDVSYSIRIQGRQNRQCRTATIFTECKSALHNQSNIQVFAQELAELLRDAKTQHENDTPRESYASFVMSWHHLECYFSRFDVSKEYLEQLNKDSKQLGSIKPHPLVRRTHMYNLRDDNDRVKVGLSCARIGIELLCNYNIVRDLRVYKTLRG